MRKKNFLNSILQNTSCPQGFWGRMILRGMNCSHASLAHRGMKQVEWQPEWNVLDIGCGGGANLKRRHRLVGRKRGFCQETQRATCGKEMFHTARERLFFTLRRRDF